jgi:outer membrane protein assembly factor BamE (lipoprotein component of BamABCDE complex)
MKQYKLKLWIGIAIAISLFAVFICMIWFWLSCQHKTFNPVIWRDENQVQAGVRLEMADDLIAHDKLNGMTRVEVVNLLGEPTKTNKFKDWDLVYWLGQERSFIPIDSEWLVVYFDANGLVRDYRIVKD